MTRVSDSVGSWPAVAHRVGRVHAAARAGAGARVLHDVQPLLLRDQARRVRACAPDDCFSSLLDTSPVKTDQNVFNLRLALHL